MKKEHKLFKKGRKIIIKQIKKYEYKNVSRVKNESKGKIKSNTNRQKRRCCKKRKEKL